MSSPVYSEESIRWMARERRKLVIRRVRQTLLILTLLVVTFWGLLTWRADHQTFAWTEPVSIAFVALLDDQRGSAGEEEKSHVRRFLSRSGRRHSTLSEAEEWIAGEYARWSGDATEKFDFYRRGPLELTTPPPDLPSASAGFFERWQKTRGFLKYFQELPDRPELQLGTYDVYIFIYFYDLGDEQRREQFSQFDSIADRRSRIGVVFAPLDHRLDGNTCAVIAHELCHTLGASDKYDAEGSVYPQGFAEPNKSPLYPQDHAEIMALGRPISPGKDENVLRIADCIVGESSAREMNWVD